VNHEYVSEAKWISKQGSRGSTHIKIASIAAAGASQSEDRNDKQKTGFFDSIGHFEI
jgi:hypothetical protein